MSEAREIVLFDIDGTLLRGAGPHHKNALIEGIRQVTGITTTLDGIATAGMLDRDLITLMLRAAGYADAPTYPVLSEISEACQTVYLRNCASDLRQFVCPGVPEFLQELQEHRAVLGLVTGNLREIGWKKVELAGLRNYFAIGAFSEDGHTRTELARIAAERAAALADYWGEEPYTVALIGDHANDIEAAKANGFYSVAAATGISPASELAQFSPDLVVSNLGEITAAELLHRAKGQTRREPPLQPV